jgi:hypothetical protein
MNGAIMVSLVLCNYQRDLEQIRDKHGEQASSG